MTTSHKANLRAVLRDAVRIFVFVAVLTVPVGMFAHAAAGSNGGKLGAAGIVIVEGLKRPV